ncbi:MAG: hypothetical protein ACFFEO_17935, partial [Candidatus Thorarchaeota archaeon]
LYNAHCKVLNVRDSQGGAYTWGVHHFDDPPQSGTIEFWLYMNDGSGGSTYRRQQIHFRASDDSIAFRARLRLMTAKVEYHTGSNWVEFADCEDETWYHHKITFNTTSDTYDWYIDGVLQVNDGNFLNPVFNIGSLNIKGGWTSTSSCYVDAIGFSWNFDYSVGDNLNEGLLLSYDNSAPLDWQGYSVDDQANRTILGNTTIPMPSYGQHKIQVYGNSSLGIMYQSSIRYFTICPINIITPENMTYTQPMNGYFPATFGFENDLSSTHPQGLISKAGSGTIIEVIDQLDGHNKITRLYDGSSGTSNYANLSHTFSPQTTGVVEFWFRRSGVEEVIHIDLWNETLECLSIYSQNRGSGLAFEYYNGTDYVTIISHNSDQWYHHRLDFNCTSGTFDWYIDEVLRGEDLLLRDPTLYFVRFNVWTRGWGSTGYNVYIDGLGVSWDKDYNVGDNLNEGLLLSYENSTVLNWKGYSLDGQANKTILGNKTIPMPSYGLHSIQIFGNSSLGMMYQSPKRYFSISPIDLISPENITYTQPMGGYYPATYGFESDLINGYPSDWSIMEGGGCTVNIVSEIGGHKNIVDLYDNGVGTLNRAEINNTFIDQTIGTIEFWFMRSSPAEYIRWRLWDGFTEATNIGSAGGYFVFGNGTWNNISPCNNDQWYHIKVDFNTVTDSFNLTIDGVRELTNGAFINDVDNINILQFYTRGWGTSNYRGYFDAVGYSWDPDYNVGDNRYEGLLLSYHNTTTLDWIGYSLDRQNNITISGYTTIPLPNNGLHSLAIYANETSGVYLTSDLRYFTVLTSAPTISAISPLPYQYFGVNAPSYSIDVQGVNVDSSWYSLDNGTTNITFSSNSGTISQTEWIEFPHGYVQINFYVNDSFGRIGSDTIL